MDNTTLSEIFAIASLLALALFYVAFEELQARRHPVSDGDVEPQADFASACQINMPSPRLIPVLVPGKGSPADHSHMQYFNPSLLTPKSEAQRKSELQQRTTAVVSKTELFGLWRVRW